MDTKHRWVCFSFVLTSTCVLAQSADTGSPPSDRPLATYRKEPGIDENVWKPLGGPGITSVKGKQAKLPRKWDLAGRSVPSANPDRVSLLRVGIRTTPVGEGFVLVETRVESESSTSTTTELSWLGLVSVQSQTNSDSQVSGTFTGSTRIESVITRKLDKLRSLDLQLDMLKPGYRWSHDYGMAVETGSKASLTSRQNKVAINVKQDCEVTPGGPATNFSPSLTGSYFQVTCRSSEDTFRELLYFDDYAFFLPKRTKTKPFDLEYKLMSVPVQ
ncbi:MAG TPA: hypothetical protein VEL09_12815 [Burkholderiales bacterium]|nr:hypothetical protein [Burkholderiales bacterium]